MMSARSIGSQIQLVYQVNFPTFTPDQFTQVLKAKGFQVTPSQVITPQGPVQTQLFSKGNIIISFAQNPQNPNQIQIVFQILNTVSLTSAFGGVASPDQDITAILMGLNVVEDVVSLITFNCITRAEARIDPIKGLTAGIKPALLEKIKEAFASSPFGSSLNVISLRLGTAFPLQKGIQLILEPLSSDPTKFFVHLIFQTDDMKEFNEFIRGFGEDIIRSLIEVVGSSV